MVSLNNRLRARDLCVCLEEVPRIPMVPVSVPGRRVINQDTGFDFLLAMAVGASLHWAVSQGSVQLAARGSL